VMQTSMIYRSISVKTFSGLLAITDDGAITS
jgi:hypothetical protein